LESSIVLEEVLTFNSLKLAQLPHLNLPFREALYPSAATGS